MESLQTQGIALPRLGLGTFRIQGAACQERAPATPDLGFRAG
jgi:2,5-diketo-D-gluconate reductase B